MIGTNFFDIQLVDPTLSEVGVAIDDDAGVCNVLTADSPAEATIFSDNQGPSAPNPLTFTDGRIKCFTNASVSTVDITIMTNAGRSVFIKGLTVSQHRVVIDSNRRDQVALIPFAASDATEVDTGFDIPADAIIEDCYLLVTTLDVGETLDVGLLAAESGGDANGFLILAGVATAGVSTGYATVNDGSTSDFFDAGTYGALLASQINGSDAAATSGGQVREFHRTDGVARSISYTGSSGSDTAAGFIVLHYTLLG